ncbi:hypothetical protein G7054_g7259 [Neopestalotiopsis clavispora]|nr:hypothetical protein G7054_g7259 [Neopestalotiopsis clavispora]
MESFEVDPQAIKQLQLLDAEVADVNNEILAQRWMKHQPIFEKRQKAIANIPGFWATVLDNASIELEGAITNKDSEIFANALTHIEVTRPEISVEPRSVGIEFHFKPNEWFADSVLSKNFYWRRGKDGSSSLVSDPIKVNWKPGKDVTNGLTDAAYALWVAQKNAGMLDGVFAGEQQKKRDAAARALPEYKALAQLLEKEYNDEADFAGATSFFNFFSYRGRKGTVYEEEYLVNSVRRLVERVEATKAEIERLVFGLVRRGMFERARTVEALMLEVLEGCKKAIGEVFPQAAAQQVVGEEAGEAAEGVAPTAAGEEWRPTGGDAVLAGNLEQKWRTQPPPAVTAMERLSLLGS